MLEVYSFNWKFQNSHVLKIILTEIGLLYLLT